MQIKKVKLSEVKGWAKNPRGIKTEDFERLKTQIKELGTYKPLISYYDEAEKKYIVLGGNMRLKAYADMGVNEVDIVVIKPKDEAQKLKFALSDNDRAGYYEEDKLAELLFEFKDDFVDGLYKVDMKAAQTVEEILANFSPTGIDEIALPEGENSGFQQMTFVLSDAQIGTVREAMTKAKEGGKTEGGENENQNGNALYFICADFINGHKS
jgi:hypothetical protein